MNSFTGSNCGRRRTGGLRSGGMALGQRLTDQGNQHSFGKGDSLGRPVRAFLAGLMLLAGLILLAACANLGSLFAARRANEKVI